MGLYWTVRPTPGRYSLVRIASPSGKLAHLDSTNWIVGADGANPAGTAPAVAYRHGGQLANTLCFDEGMSRRNQPGPLRFPARSGRDCWDVYDARRPHAVGRQASPMGAKVATTPRLECCGIRTDMKRLLMFCALLLPTASIALAAGR